MSQNGFFLLQFINFKINESLGSTLIIKFHRFFRGANKQDEALEMYGRAANLYKMAKKWSKAGQTFVTVATHHAKLGNKHDSATNYVDASNCFKKSDPKGIFFSVFLFQSIFLNNCILSICNICQCIFLVIKGLQLQTTLSNCQSYIFTSSKENTNAR